MTTTRKTHGEKAADFVNGLSPREMLDTVADVTVEVMYRDLDDDILRSMLINDNELEPVPLVVALNRSIQNELDRRQREREDQEAGR